MRNKRVILFLSFLLFFNYFPPFGGQMQVRCGQIRFKWSQKHGCNVFFMFTCQLDLCSMMIFLFLPFFCVNLLFRAVSKAAALPPLLSSKGAAADDQRRIPFRRARFVPNQRYGIT